MGPVRARGAVARQDQDRVRGGSPLGPVSALAWRDLRRRGRPRIRELVDRSLLCEVVRITARPPRPGLGGPARNGTLRAAPVPGPPIRPGPGLDRVSGLRLKARSAVQLV